MRTDSTAPLPKSTALHPLPPQPCSFQRSNAHSNAAHPADRSQQLPNSHKCKKKWVASPLLPRDVSRSGLFLFFPILTRINAIREKNIKNINTILPRKISTSHSLFLHLCTWFGSSWGKIRQMNQPSYVRIIYILGGEIIIVQGSIIDISSFYIYFIAVFF